MSTFEGYMVDTNVPSELTRDRPDPNVADFLKRAGKEHLFLSVITIGEICQGIAELPASRKRDSLQVWLDADVRPWFFGRILPIDEVIAERWGHLTSHAKQRGLALKVADGLIAATAIEHRLTIATRNVKDFAGLSVAVVNPWAAL